MHQSNKSLTPFFRIPFQTRGSLFTPPLHTTYNEGIVQHDPISALLPVPPRRLLPPPPLPPPPPLGADADLHRRPLTLRGRPEQREGGRKPFLFFVLLVSLARPVASSPSSSAASDLGFVLFLVEAPSQLEFGGRREGGGGGGGGAAVEAADEDQSGMR